MSLQWTDDLATNVGEIDLQHKALIKKINDLLSACSEQKGTEEIKTFLQFLTGYVIVHFADEERLMTEQHFPGAGAHRLEHRDFRERLARLREEYQAGMHDAVLAEAVWTAGQWFIEHIKRTDLALAGFIRGRKLS